MNCRASCVQTCLPEYGEPTAWGQRFEAQGKPFDPTWHEAIDVVSANALGVKVGTVVEVERPGYRIRGSAEDRLFRPARVVVAN